MENIFKGFKMVNSAVSDFTNDYLYFVRTNKDKGDGYLYFNGKKYGTAKDAADELKGIIGTLPEGYSTVVAYIAAAEKAAKDYADAQTINSKTGHTITLDGADIKLDGYTKPSTSGPIEATDTVNAALGKLEKGLENAVAGGLQEILSGNGINVSAVSANKQTVSAKIASGDNILSVDANGIKSTLSIQYDSTNRKIKLSGVTGSFSEISTADFVKDGMLHDQVVMTATATTMKVTFPKGGSNEYTGLISGNTYIFLEFNNDGTKSYDKLDATQLVDVYTAGDGLKLDDHKFSVKVDSGSEGFLTVGADGVKVSGIQSAINSAVATEKSRAEGVEGTLSSLTTDAKGNLVTAINEVDANADANTSAISILNGNDTTDGSVKKQIKDAIEALDATVSGKNTSEQIKVTVVETNGKLTSLSVEAGKFDVDGAATSVKTEVIGTASESANTLGKIETIILDNENVTASALTSLDARVTANANAITAETAARESAVSAEATARENADKALLGDATASTFTNATIHDVKRYAIAYANGVADSATTSAITYTDSAINALDAVVTGETSGVTVTVTETNGKLTSATAELHISATANNAINMNNDGLFAAMYYEDLDA